MTRRELEIAIREGEELEGLVLQVLHGLTAPGAKFSLPLAQEDLTRFLLGAIRRQGDSLAIQLRKLEWEEAEFLKKTGSR